MAGTIVNILVGVGAAAVVLGVVLSRLRRIRQGDSSPCGGCSGCASQQEDSAGCPHSCGHGKR